MFERRNRQCSLEGDKVQVFMDIGCSEPRFLDVYLDK
jgi:hypothetical protein